MQRSVVVASRANSASFGLIDYLLRTDNKVIVLGDIQPDSHDNLTNPKFLENLILFPSNLRRPLSDIHAVHQIYHLACPTRQDYDDDPIEALETCFMATKNLLDVALRCNASVVLPRGSRTTRKPSEEASRDSWNRRLRERKRSRSSGDLPDAAKRRRQSTRQSPVPTRTLSYFDEGNRLAEMLCLAYRSHFGLVVRIVPTDDSRASKIAAHEPVNCSIANGAPPAAGQSKGATPYYTGELVQAEQYVRELVGAMDEPDPTPLIGTESSQDRL